MNAIPREYIRFFEPDPLPDKPRPLTAGWESIDWSASPLYHMYGLPGQTTRETRTRFRRGSKK